MIHCLKHCIMGRRLPPNSAGKAVIQISCDQVSIPWWRKLNNVTSFLDLSNIKFTTQVQEYNPTDDAILWTLVNIWILPLYKLLIHVICDPMLHAQDVTQQQYKILTRLNKFTYIIRSPYLCIFQLNKRTISPSMALPLFKRPEKSS